jgi:hypothetical protein
VCRLLIAPQLLAPWAATRVGGGMNRRQPDHLCREAGIALDRFSQLAPLRQELDDQIMGTRVLQNIGSPPKISGSLTTRRRPRPRSRSDAASAAGFA